jgi:hypothetical protein
MTLDLNEVVRDEIGENLNPVLAAGFKVIESDYSEADFGNFYVELLRGTDELRIVRDRGQYMVQGDEAELKRAGLWRAFDSKMDFFSALTRYAIDTNE